MIQQYNVRLTYIFLIKCLILQIKSQSIIPLKECHEVICDTVRKTENYISVGEKLSETTEIETLESFNANASSLGNLPEVPNIKEVPSITFQYDQLSEDNILKFCSGIGIVSRIAPIQVINHVAYVFLFCQVMVCKTNI